MTGRDNGGGGFAPWTRMQLLGQFPKVQPPCGSIMAASTSRTSEPASAGTLEFLSQAQAAPGEPQPVAPRKHWSSHPIGYARQTPSTWFTSYKPLQEAVDRSPPDDFRDTTPPLFLDVINTYSPVIQEGQWTFGLWEMWGKKAKYAKASVHIPCWNSFSWLPWRWRGVVCGRTPRECFWTGLRYTRWARAVYAAGLGYEYHIPGWLAPVTSQPFKDRIAALCLLNFLMGIGLGLVVGFCLTCGGYGLINCAGCYSCHSREKLRRRYNLPPAFGLPPGIDDALVHIFCFYCASHQELRELVLRGVDGPGMHILDVLPNSFPNAPGGHSWQVPWSQYAGIEARLAQRRQQLQPMLGREPPRFQTRTEPPRVVQMVRGASRKGDGTAGAAGHGR